MEWNDNPNDKERLKIREKLYDLLKKTSEKKINVCPMRYYKMTKEEYNNVKSYCFNVILHYEDKIYEGFCYDIRMLMQERYLEFNLKCGFYPIILKVERWNWMVENEEQLALYSKIPGILAFPMIKDELLTLLKNINNPITIMIVDSNKIMKIRINEEYNYVKENLYDISKEERFGPKKIITTSIFEHSSIYPVLDKIKISNDRLKNIKEQVLHEIELMNISNIVGSSGKTIKQELFQQAARLLRGRLAGHGDGERVVRRAGPILKPLFN